MIPIASDLSFECLQKRLRSGELRTPDLNERNRKLFRVSGYRQFIADPDMDGGDCLQPRLEPARSSTLNLRLNPLMPFITPNK